MTGQEGITDTNRRDTPTELLDLLKEVSRRLTRTSDARIEESIRYVLGLIGLGLELDRVTVWDYQKERAEFLLVGDWRASEIALPPETLSPRWFPWVSSRLLEGKTVIFSDLEELPVAAAVDRRSFERLGTRSVFACPLRVAEETLGVLALSVLRGRRSWSDLAPHLTRLVGDAIAAALVRRRSRSNLRLSEERYRSYIENSTEGIWCMEFGEPLSLDLPEEEQIQQIYDCGRMVEVNEAFARMYGYKGSEEMGLWRLKDRLPKDSRTMEMIRTASRLAFTLADLETHELDRKGNTRIFLNNISGQIEDGKLLRIWGTQRDVTDLRKREAELHELTDQLARVVRVRTMGELTAAIAHEIGQPLSAIATNARAAQRFLEAPDPDLREIAEILDDIVADDRRAAEVSQRMRALLSTHATPRIILRIESLILAVVEILRSDAIFKRVEVSLDLDESLPSVRCDGVQIQQVIINLVLNGCEAVEGLELEDRQLVIRTAREGSEAIRVSVMDHGIGFGGTLPEELFEPFNTSKAGGLGMGLSICRTIVEDHGGRIWGCENPEGGATFHFTLPVAGPGSAET